MYVEDGIIVITAWDTILKAVLYILGWLFIVMMVCTIPSWLGDEIPQAPDGGCSAVASAGCMTIILLVIAVFIGSITGWQPPLSYLLEWIE